MEVDNTLLIATAFIMAMAPFATLVWVKIADVTKKSMDSADETAVTEKTNPVLIPGTATVQSSQAPAGNTCPVQVTK